MTYDLRDEIIALLMRNAWNIVDVHGDGDESGCADVADEILALIQRNTVEGGEPG